MRLLEIGGSVSLRLALPPPPDSTAPSTIVVREVPRDEVERLLAGSRLQASRLENLDEAAPEGWRCWMALDGSEVVHHSFVAPRPEGPLLFRVFTDPPRRRSGLFRHVVGTIGMALAREGERALYSSCGWTNTASLRAHAAAGFVVIRRRIDPIVLGVDVRKAPRRMISMLRSIATWGCCGR